jgi:RNAse (barnase) inhibitor barstar
MSAFIFSDRDDVQAVHRAELPPNIKSEDALLDALSSALRFPDYFGDNWNALAECIRDLSWLPPGDLVLIHKDLPLADNRAALSIYLSILRNAVENWKTKGSNLIFASPEKPDSTGELALLAQRRFLVVFPSDTQSTVESLLAGGAEIC